MPLISLITPVYNCRDVLDRCVASLLAQTFGQFELILVDDGSTDGSGEICDRWKERDARIRVIHQQNGGSGKARSAGLAAACGDWITFPDADDTLEPDMLARLWEVAAQGGTDLVMCGCRHHARDGKGEAVWDALPAAAHPEGADAVRRYYFTVNDTLTFVPWNKLYRTDIIRRYGLRFPDIRRGQDAAFNAEYFTHITSLTAIPYAGYHYYENTEDTYSKKFPANIFEIFTDLAQVWYDKQEEWGLSDDRQISEIIGDLHLGNIGLCLIALHTAEPRLSYRDKVRAVAAIADHPLAARAIRESATVERFPLMLQTLFQQRKFGRIVRLVGFKLMLKKRFYPVFRFLKKRLTGRADT